MRLFLQGLDQRGLAVARRRLGEVLGRVQGVQVERLAGGQRIGSSSSSCLPPGGQTRRWPSNFRTLPWALKSPAPAVIATSVTMKTAGAIWLATNRA